MPKDVPEVYAYVHRSEIGIDPIFWYMSLVNHYLFCLCWRVGHAFKNILVCREYTYRVPMTPANEADRSHCHSCSLPMESWIKIPFQTSCLDKSFHPFSSKLIERGSAQRMKSTLATPKRSRKKMMHTWQCHVMCACSHKEVH